MNKHLRPHLTPIHPRFGPGWCEPIAGYKLTCHEARGASRHSLNWSVNRVYRKRYGLPGPEMAGDRRPQDQRHRPPRGSGRTSEEGQYLLLLLLLGVAKE